MKDLLLKEDNLMTRLGQAVSEAKRCSEQVARLIHEGVGHEVSKLAEATKDFDIAEDRVEALREEARRRN